jgi:hypothetical protein
LHFSDIFYSTNFYIQIIRQVDHFKRKERRRYNATTRVYAGTHDWIIYYDSETPPRRMEYKLCFKTIQDYIILRFEYSIRRIILLL